MPVPYTEADRARYRVALQRAVVGDSILRDSSWTTGLIGNTAEAVQSIIVNAGKVAGFASAYSLLEEWGVIKPNDPGEGWRFIATREGLKGRVAFEKDLIKEGEKMMKRSNIAEKKDDKELPLDLRICNYFANQYVFSNIAKGQLVDDQVIRETAAHFNVGGHHVRRSLRDEGLAKYRDTAPGDFAMIYSLESVNEMRSHMASAIGDYMDGKRPNDQAAVKAHAEKHSEFLRRRRKEREQKAMEKELEELRAFKEKIKNGDYKKEALDRFLGRKMQGEPVVVDAPVEKEMTVEDGGIISVRKSHDLSELTQPKHQSIQFDKE